MDKLRQFVNGFFISVYVIAALGTFLLIMIRDANEAQGLHLFEVFAPYIVSAVGISFVLHFLLSCVVLVPRTSKG